MLSSISAMPSATLPWRMRIEPSRLSPRVEIGVCEAATDLKGAAGGRQRAVEIPTRDEDVRLPQGELAELRSFGLVREQSLRLGEQSTPTEKLRCQKWLPASASDTRAAPRRSPACVYAAALRSPKRMQSRARPIQKAAFPRRSRSSAAKLLDASAAESRSNASFHACRAIASRPAFSESSVTRSTIGAS
jgi:hypothetical protein